MSTSTAYRKAACSAKWLLDLTGCCVFFLLPLAVVWCVALAAIIVIMPFRFIFTGRLDE